MHHLLDAKQQSVRKTIGTDSKEVSSIGVINHQFIKSIKVKTFFVSCGDLDEEGFLVEAEDINQAREEAMRELGWYVVETEEDVE